jgi:hypothetical protein
MQLVTVSAPGHGIDPCSDHRDDRPMDLSELGSPQQDIAADDAAAACPSIVAGWPVTTALGGEVAAPLTHALEATCELQATGRIDRAGLSALRAHIEQARHAAMVAQQIARLALGGTQQQHEPLNLARALRDAAAAREHDLHARGLTVKQSVQPAEIVGDPTLLASLLNALFDWSMRHARTAVDIRLDTKPWPTHARLVCRFGHVPEDQAPSDPRQSVGVAARTALDCLQWHLLLHLARTMELLIDRDDSAADTVLTLEFPRTANDTLEGAVAIELNERLAAVPNARPLAGSQVLVIAPRRQVRNQVAQAVSHMGLQLEFVSSVGAAREFCQQGLPQAIVYESMVYDIAFDTLRNDIRRQCPELAWIEVIEQGEAFEISSFGGTSMARVGRDAIANSLPSALMFELAKSL